MPCALVKLRPGHLRQDLLTTESFTAACRRLAYGARQRQCRHKARTKPYEAPVWSIATYIRVVVKVSPLPKVPLGTAAVLHCWPSRLCQTLSMRCNGRRGHYLLELGYAEGPTGSITLHEGGVIVVLLYHRWRCSLKDMLL